MSTIPENLAMSPELQSKLNYIKTKCYFLEDINNFKTTENIASILEQLKTKDRAEIIRAINEIYCDNCGELIEAGLCWHECPDEYL